LVPQEIYSELPKAENIPLDIIYEEVFFFFLKSLKHKLFIYTGRNFLKILLNYFQKKLTLLGSSMC